MAVISTSTSFSFNTYADKVNIFTVYDAESLPNILQGFIASEDGVLEGDVYEQGDLVIQAKNYPSDIDFYLNSEGEFVIEAIDESAYSINSNTGQLVYNL